MATSLAFGSCSFSLPGFYSSVDKTLAQCQCKNLTKFSLRANYDSRFQSRVDNWIHFATTSKVQQLHLELNFREDADRFVFGDDSFFINPHFTHLHLEHCFFNPVGPINWNNLTHLTISDVSLDHGLIENILSGSPLLDTLKLYYCYGYSWLNITSKSVKNLVLHGYHDPDDIINYLDDVIGINAPYISSLEIVGTFLL
uniref:putative F-box protein At1g49610 n=1 Tax=Erigeron canadensis TaxID=72917 RepID=UPI001CB9299A|nr:putative F-box protein At1g49610 [Erigeron canadensis]